MTEEDADAALALFALDPHGLVLQVRSPACGARDRLLSALGALSRLHRCPLGIEDDRLLGGLDLAATLATGRRVSQPGLLAQADGGLLVLPMAERLSRETASLLCSALDEGVLRTARTGAEASSPCRIGIVLLDEGEGDEAPPAALLERAAFRLDEAPAPGNLPDASVLAKARALLPRVRCDERLTTSLCMAAEALGIASLRAPLMALRAARGAAALDGRVSVDEPDMRLAARLVLSWRATCLPDRLAASPPQQAPPGEPATDPPEDAGALPPPEPEADGPEADGSAAGSAAGRTVASAQAAIPPDLLRQLQRSATDPASHGPAGGRGTGAAVRPAAHGRPLAPRPGRPSGDTRIALVETLRAAAPWQRLRRPHGASGAAAASSRLAIRAADFRVRRRASTPRGVAIFVVDASGSAALNRLAEAKGAIERLLSECYVRRDRVALIVFRGRAAEILLPPTASLTRARRCLAGLPGGGGTPLAAGLEEARLLAQALRRQGETPLLVLLTDGRGNVALDGSSDRARATRDTARCADRLRHDRVAALLVDIAPRGEPRAQALAAGMGAHYLRLPDAGALSRAVREAGVAGRPRSQAA